MKKLISLCLCFVLCIGILPINAIAEGEKDEVTSVQEITPEVLAKDLKTLGLFKGVSDTDFALERKPTRTEALVMLIRVLGQEQTALNGTWEHPFTDVADWADSYVGYAYTNGLTNGISETEFGSNNIAPDYMYLTFVLRALGYSDADGDFVWNDPYALASDSGILPKEHHRENFLRGDVVNISYAALNALIKDSQKTLADTLIEKKVFTEETFSAVYRLGAVALDINPFTEVRKMIRQYGEYDKVSGRYTLVMDHDTTPPDGHYKSYENLRTLSFSEDDNRILLRGDHSSVHRCSGESNNTEYFLIYLTESADAYEIEGYQESSYKSLDSSYRDTDTAAAKGTMTPEKWDGSLLYPYNWTGMVVNQGPFHYEFSIRKMALWSFFVDSLSMEIDVLLYELRSTMQKHGLTSVLDDFGLVVDQKPAAPVNYLNLSDFSYEGNISDEDIARLRSYAMIYDPDEHSSYSDQKSFNNCRYCLEEYYSGRTADFKNFQEAHDYLRTAFSDEENFRSEALGLYGKTTSFEVLMNLFLIAAATELNYISENVEVIFHTCEDLLYHAEDKDRYGVNVRGTCEFIIKNDNFDEWTYDDWEAISKAFESAPNYDSPNFRYVVRKGLLPQYLDVDVLLSTGYEVELTRVALVEEAKWDAIVKSGVPQSKVTVYGSKNGTLGISSRKTIGINSHNWSGTFMVIHGDAPKSENFLATDEPIVGCLPDPGYWLSDLLINGKSVGAHYRYPLDITGDNISVSAVFERIEDPVTLTLTVFEYAVIYVHVDGCSFDYNGDENTSKDLVFPRGTEVTLYFKTGVTHGGVPETICDITINGKPIEFHTDDRGGTEYTLIINEDITVVAHSYNPRGW